MGIIKNYFYLLPSLMMALSAFAKLFLFKPGSVELPFPGMEEKIFPLAILELCCVAIFVIPRTRNVGFLFICSYLGGAIAVNIVTNAMNPEVPAILLALFWIGMFQKNKELFLFKNIA